MQLSLAPICLVLALLSFKPVVSDIQSAVASFTPLELPSESGKSVVSALTGLSGLAPPSAIRLSKASSSSYLSVSCASTPGTVIKILEANYTEGSCKKSALTYISGRCDNLQACTKVWPSSAFKDPCPGTQSSKQQMSVSYECLPAPQAKAPTAKPAKPPTSKPAGSVQTAQPVKTPTSKPVKAPTSKPVAEVPKKDYLSLICTSGRVNVLQANFTAGKCFSNQLGYVAGLCNTLPACLNIWPSSKFVNPCPSSYATQQLSVSYECRPEVTADSGSKSWKISCSYGLIKVLDAIYTVGTCKKNVKPYFTSGCDGLKTCTSIWPSPSFQDPCAGTTGTQRMNVRYECLPAGTPGLLPPGKTPTLRPTLMAPAKRKLSLRKRNA